MSFVSVALRHLLSQLCVKVAVSVMGPPIVIEAGLVVPGERACSAPTPVGEMVTASRHGIDRDSYSAVSPSTSWTHCATCSVSHRQKILRVEIRCVYLVSGRRNSVRDSSATSPASSMRNEPLWHRSAVKLCQWCGLSRAPRRRSVGATYKVVPSTVKLRPARFVCDSHLNMCSE